MSEQPKKIAVAAPKPEPKKARHVRTPAEVAQDLLDAAEARHARALAAAKKAAAAAEAAQKAKAAADDEAMAAAKAVAFLSGNPDLPTGTGSLSVGAELSSGRTS